jgi:hypothetical protein
MYIFEKAHENFLGKLSRRFSHTMNRDGLADKLEALSKAWEIYKVLSHGYNSYEFNKTDSREWMAKLAAIQDDPHNALIIEWR